MSNLSICSIVYSIGSRPSGRDASSLNRCSTFAAAALGVGNQIIVSTTSTAWGRPIAPIVVWNHTTAQGLYKNRMEPYYSDNARNDSRGVRCLPVPVLALPDGLVPPDRVGLAG